MPASLKRRGPARLVRRDCGERRRKVQDEVTRQRSACTLKKSYCPCLICLVRFNLAFRIGGAVTDSLHGGAGMEERVPCPPLQGGGQPATPAAVTPPLATIRDFRVPRRAARSGQRLVAGYEILQQLGQGGMGVVYK